MFFQLRYNAAECAKLWELAGNCPGANVHPPGRTCQIWELARNSPTRVTPVFPASAGGIMSPLSAVSVRVVRGVFPGMIRDTLAMVGAVGVWSVFGRVARALATIRAIRVRPRRLSRAPALGWTARAYP